MFSFGTQCLSPAELTNSFKDPLLFFLSFFHQQNLSTILSEFEKFCLLMALVFVYMIE